MMNPSKSDRWFLFSGIVFAILFLIVSIPKGELGFMAAPEAVAAFYAQNADLYWWHGYLGALSGLFLLLFAGAVRRVLQEAGSQVGLWADLAFGGGVVASALTIAGHAIQLGLAPRAGAAAGIAPATAVAMSDTLGALTGVALPVALALFVGATGMALIRSRLLPGWFGWLSVIVAVALASPAMYLTMLFGLLWTIASALWLFARAGRASQPAANVAASSQA